MNIQQTIIYEDDCLLLVNKPNGLMVEPDRNNHPNLLTEVKKYLKVTSPENNYVQHLHRLDRPTSGIVLFTKKREHLHFLSNQFAQREVEKIYVALTENGPSRRKGVLTHWHRKEKKKAVLYNSPIEFSEEAILEYDVTERGNLFFWTIHLKTGKYHQIRAQLQSIHCSIIGDELYGSSKTLDANTIALHAQSISFTHPQTLQVINCTCQAPAFFE